MDSMGMAYLEHQLPIPRVGDAFVMRCPWGTRKLEVVSVEWSDEDQTLTAVMKPFLTVEEAPDSKRVNVQDTNPYKQRTDGAGEMSFAEKLQAEAGQ